MTAPLGANDSPGSSSNLVRLPSPTFALPGHTAATTRRGPGRPRRVRVAPDADQAVYEEAVRAALEDHVANDAVVAASELRDRSSALLGALVLAVAREQASIAYEIMFKIRDRRDLERARSRRIDALHTLARLVLEQRKAEAESPLVPPAVALRVTNALLRELERVAAETLGPEAAARLMRIYREKQSTVQADLPG